LNVNRFFAFIDIDYFFAQVEENFNPSLRGKPVVICVFSGRTKESGAVATANYVARKYGVKAGMPISEAKRLLSGIDAFFLPMRREFYVKVSNDLMNYLREKYRKVEIVSVDEAYVQYDNVVFEEAVSDALKMKEEILKKFNLRVTIGLSQIKVIAKIASEEAKPDGFKAVGPNEILDYVLNLKIGRIPGIGKKTEEKLRGIGIERLKDLKGLSFNELGKVLGNARAKYLLKLANLELNEEIIERKKKQFSRTITLPKNSNDIVYIKPYLNNIVKQLYSKINGLPKVVGVIVITDKLEVISRVRKSSSLINEDRAKEIVEKLLGEIFKRGVIARRIGVKVSEITYSSRSIEDFI